MLSSAALTRCVRRWLPRVLCTIIIAPVAASASAETITSGGPLTAISTSPDLNCAVNHEGDSYGEFFGGTACGTLIAVNGTLYGPANIPAGGSAAPRTPWTAVSQSKSGAGTQGNPFRIITVVDGGGLRVTQTDTYVEGVESYGTRVDVSNTSDQAQAITVYRAGDCYLQNSDIGYGALDTASGAVSCTAGLEPGARIEQWAPLTSGSHAMESSYGSVWARVGSQLPFADTCGCGTYQDNGAGLSWTQTIGAHGSAGFAHLTAFSPTGATQVADSDGDGLPDAWESPSGGVDTDGDGTPDLKLSDYGATPDKPDVFVQVGWTTTTCGFFQFNCHALNHAPSLAALVQVQAAFKAHGIRLHVDAGPRSIMNPDTNTKWGSLSAVDPGRMPEAPSLLAGEPADHNIDNFDWAAFQGYRDDAMTARRARVFHFALYVGRFDSRRNYLGLARRAMHAPNAGRDFLIAHDLKDVPIGSVVEGTTFMHELGHNLGLSHGGAAQDTTVNYKPNYPSVMNYYWSNYGVDKAGEAGVLDYSAGTLDPFDENAVEETRGLTPAAAAAGLMMKLACPGSGVIHGPFPAANPEDYDCHDGPTAGVRAIDVNNDGTRQVLTDHDDWDSLVFDGGGALGGASDAGDVAASQPIDEPTIDELHAASADPLTLGLETPGILTMQQHTTAPAELKIVNRHLGPRTYHLTVDADGIAVSGLPEVVTLDGGATRTVQLTIAAGDPTNAATFEVDAASDANTDRNAAVTSVRVVDHTVPDQPGGSVTPSAPLAPVSPQSIKRGGVVIADASSKALTLSLDGGRALRLKRGAISATVALAPGRHTLKAFFAKGRKATTLKLTVTSGKVVTVVASSGRRGGGPTLRSIAVAAKRRLLISLLPGRHRVQSANRKGKARTLRYGTSLSLATSTLSVRVSGHMVTLAKGAQVLFLTQKGRRVTVVARTAPRS